MHQLPIPEHEANRLARWLFAMLEAAKHRTQPVSQDALARVIEEELPWRLVQACDFPGDVPLRWKPSARRRALDRAIEFLRGTDIASVTIGDLCHIASVSERTLEYIFRENLSLTPCASYAC
jgi:transcriptional regulator GlxA family with amidase domain